jgi:hypothetical protein
VNDQYISRCGSCVFLDTEGRRRKKNVGYACNAPLIANVPASVIATFRRIKVCVDDGFCCPFYRLKKAIRAAKEAKS